MVLTVEDFTKKTRMDGGFHRKDYIKAKSRKLKLKANAATIIGERRLLELLEHAFAGIAMISAGGFLLI
ncbi:MAG: hypothetical protein IKP87_00670 [Victivallales bacterium]|nr:hypothetical protein [Victivallales bacterium]